MTVKTLWILSLAAFTVTGGVFIFMRDPVFFIGNTVLASLSFMVVALIHAKFGIHPNEPVFGAIPFDSVFDTVIDTTVRLLPLAVFIAYVASMFVNGGSL